jgi:hypothetical protein
MTSKAAKVAKRILEHTTNSFSNINENLYCQACNKTINEESSSVKRHMKTQSHKDNLQKFNEKKNEKKCQSSLEQIKNVKKKKDEICEEYVLCSMIVGLSFNQAAQIRSTFLKKYPPIHVGAIGCSSDSIENYGNKCGTIVKAALEERIDRNQIYSVMFDETPDEYEDKAVCNIYYKQEDGLLLLLQCTIIDDAVNNEKVLSLVMDLLMEYNLSRHKCIAICTDSAAYNLAAYCKLKLVCPNALHILDVAHTLATCIKNVLNADSLKETMEYYKESHGYFVHSRVRKCRYKASLNDDEEEKINEELEEGFYSVSLMNIPPRIVESRWGTGI